MSRTSAASTVLPLFEDLPLGKDDPPFSAWGLWGAGDEVGTLNLLTQDVIARAAREIREGSRFSLNWSLSNPKTPGFGRSKYAFCHTIDAGPPGLCVFEDSLTFNTQKSSQWDGLRHFAYQRECLFYNDTSLSSITTSPTRLGIQNFNSVGGIAGRALLLDYYAYAIAHSIPHDPLTSSIPFSSLMSCLAYQDSISGTSTDILCGDILLIRSGYHVSYASLSIAEEEEVGNQLPPRTGGVAQEKELLRWLWESRFAAVGGDSVSFESFPGKEDAGFLLHEVLLAGWGMPIGEILWLEDLAAECAKKQRWNFFVASCPLNVDGGVASPANMLAIL